MSVRRTRAEAASRPASCFASRPLSDALPTVKAAETRRAWVGPGFTEFVAIVALMMAVTAISIDNLLPAFPAIETRFGVTDPNHLQLLVYVYMLGFGPAQIIYGPLSDALGRRPVLLASLGVYVAGCVLAMLAPSFGWLLAARVIQGMGAAAGGCSPPPSCATASPGARWRA